MNLKLLIALGLLGASLLTVPAAGKLGQDAAPLRITKWIKGKPVNLAAAKGKQVVVAEFWATWCAPCRASIPHLTELQKKFKDQVTFVGISDETEAKVKSFVDQFGDKMDYVVALDDQQKTAAGYMREFGINGIPHAFVVDLAGKVVWHGHPMSDLEAVLEKIVAGKFNLAEAQRREEGRQKLEEFFRLVSADDNPDRQELLAREIMAIESETGRLNPGQKFDPAEARKMIRFNSALRSYQVVLSTNGSPQRLAEFEKMLVADGPPDFDLAEFKLSAGQSKLFGDYFRAASGRGDETKLPALAKELAAVKSTNYELLNEWAWTILTHEAIKKRDLALATQLARAAMDACQGKEAGVVDTYARALFDSGKIAEAITQQKRAVELATDDDMRQGLQTTLKEYEARAARQ